MLDQLQKIESNLQKIENNVIDDKLLENYISKLTKKLDNFKPLGYTSLFPDQHKFNDSTATKQVFNEKIEVNQEQENIPIEIHTPKVKITEASTIESIGLSTFALSLLTDHHPRKSDPHVKTPTITLSQKGASLFGSLLHVSLDEYNSLDEYITIQINYTSLCDSIEVLNDLFLDSRFLNGVDVLSEDKLVKVVDKVVLLALVTLRKLDKQGTLYSI